MFSVASFFAGVGGIDLGFEETGEFKTVYANEFDSYASETFEMNYPTVKVDQRDIHLVPVEDVPKQMLLLVVFLVRHFPLQDIDKDLRIRREEENFSLSLCVWSKQTNQELHYLKMLKT